MMSLDRAKVAFQTHFDQVKHFVRKRLKKQSSVEEVAVTAQNRQKPHAFDEAQAKETAVQLGLATYENLSSFTIDRSLTKLVPYSFVKKHLVLPVAETADSLVVVTSDPLNIDAIEELRHLINRQIDTAYVPKAAIVAAIHEYYHGDDASVFEHMKGSQEEEVSLG